MVGCTLVAYYTEEKKLETRFGVHDTLEDSVIEERLLSLPTRPTSAWQYRSERRWCSSPENTPMLFNCGLVGSVVGSMCLGLFIAG